MVFGLIMMALVLYQATDFWRVSRGFKGFTLAKVIVRDQVIYYVVCVYSTIGAQRRIKTGLQYHLMLHLKYFG